MIETVSFSMSEMECYPKIRQRGVVTIPEEVREGLNLEEGDQLKLTVEKLN
ncbi:AbrB/MazE/SpoVT family DNA-binding domain-containing protein [Halosegnis rubeus]|jgi:AbrB family looped-hinge helix DNA binding protein|uniref:AbrB/MazE/SpoVT family DNA-binding domain-containing protein n=1 Tax=Halosegnis rubeus TaxID=2212850 RepID=A0A5N5U9H5_9EURY|nr:AbrB/MazE/SpoVT family DNA-binding domain-containing protein [Halosegnis rubeus]KAB7519245.1 AbrB/MazE/SpoVT family DNA-binding domain-containing protein [Halosegnis rubeus]